MLKQKALEKRTATVTKAKTSGDIFIEDVRVVYLPIILHVLHMEQNLLMSVRFIAL